MQIMCNVNWRLIGLLFWREATLAGFVSALSKEIIRSPKEMTLEKGLRLQHGKDVQLRDSLGSLASSKLTSYNFC